MDGFALTLAESVHEFRESSGTLNLEEHFVVVVRHLDVEVLGLGLVFWVAAGAGGLITVGHCVYLSCAKGILDGLTLGLNLFSLGARRAVILA